MASLASWFMIVLLGALAPIAIWLSPYLGLREETGGALAGALLGAATVLLGGTLERYGRRADERNEAEAKREKLRTLIAAELVNVAAGVVAAHEFMATSVEVIPQGAAPGIIDLGRYRPREMPIASVLRAELLVLSPREIDVLGTLRANLEITSANMAERGIHEHPFGLMEAIFLRDGLAFDLELLAQAFEAFAPTRKLQFPSEEPVLASTRLRQQAARGRDADQSEPST
jgi:hypothetical protein